MDGPQAHVTLNLTGCLWALKTQLYKRMSSYNYDFLKVQARPGFSYVTRKCDAGACHWRLHAVSMECEEEGCCVSSPTAPSMRARKLFDKSVVGIVGSGWRSNCDYWLITTALFVGPQPFGLRHNSES